MSSAASTLRRSRLGSLVEMRSHTEPEQLEHGVARSDEGPAVSGDPRSRVLALQATRGNAAVARMLEHTRGQQTTPAPAPPAAPAPASASAAPLETHSETHTLQFNAAIRIGESGGP